MALAEVASGKLSQSRIPSWCNSARSTSEFNAAEASASERRRVLQAAAAARIEVMSLRAESGLLDIGDDGGPFSENPDEGGGQLTFELQRGNPPARSSLPRGFLQQTARDIVAIAASALDRMTRRQPFALLVEQLAEQRTGRRSARLYQRSEPYGDVGVPGSGPRRNAQ